MWSRVTSSRGCTLEQNLKRITESGVIDVPTELLQPIIDASNNEEDRRVVMEHLRECLTESSGKRWRRICSALALTRDLVRRGDPALLVESASGRHFDLVQRLSLLERFERNTDRRVQTIIRSKAKELGHEVRARLDGAEIYVGKDPKQDQASTCSPQDFSVKSIDSASVSSMGCFSNDPPRGRLVLDGVVTVGHFDDTTSEESGPEDHAPVRYHEPKSRTRSNQPRSNDSSDSDHSPVRRLETASHDPGCSSAAPTKLESIDLLDI